MRRLFSSYTTRQQMFAAVLAALVAVPFCGVLADEPPGQPASVRDFLFGTKLKEQLKQRRSIAYENSALRKVTGDLQRMTRIPIVLDRRIDPSLLVDIRTEYVTNRTTLVTLASEVGAGVSFGSCYAYIGPKDNANLLQTRIAVVEESIRALRTKLDKEAYRKLTSDFDGSWIRLSQPRELVSQMAAAAEVAMDDSVVVPHDLWNAAVLPSISFTERALLILTQFDLEFAIDESGTLHLQEQREQVGVERRHRIRLRDKSDVVRRWRAALPNVDVVWKGSTAVVTTTVENHERLDLLASGNETPAVEAAGLKTRLFTFRTPPRTTLGTVLASLRASVPVKLVGKTEADLRDELSQFVEIDAENSPGDKFFADAFKGLNGKVEVRDSEVVIRFE